MGINIGGAFNITGWDGTQSLKITGAVDGLVIDGTGRTTYPNQIGFTAGFSGTDPGWVAMPDAVWTRQSYFNNTSYNKGGGYASSRFTAPVTGDYLFHAYSYHNKATSVQAHYVYSTWYINGAAQAVYRLCGYFQPVGYSFATEIVDILHLNAGDYVDHYLYAGGAGTNVYQAYGGMEGYLVG